MKREPRILTRALDSSHMQNFNLQIGGYGPEGYNDICPNTSPQTQPWGLDCYPSICIWPYREIPKET